MIYTVTCNPALDCAVSLARLVLGEINRTPDNPLTANGKGINVSRILLVLETLGYAASGKALGFTAGETGHLLETMLRRDGVVTDFVELPAGSTRVNVKLHAETETEINAAGAPMTPGAMAELTAKLTALQQGDVLCLCGSLPPAAPADTYATLLRAVAHTGAYTVLDTAGPSLSMALSAKPWLIKPNRQEVEELLNVKLNTLTDVIGAAGELQARGAGHVLVSMGGDGALLCAADGMNYHLPAPQGGVRGTVCAGDSLVAGFVAGWQSTGSLAEALRLGVACGSATAFADGLATAEGIRAVLAALPRPTEYGKDQQHDRTTV